MAYEIKQTNEDFFLMCRFRIFSLLLKERDKKYIIYPTYMFLIYKEEKK